MRTVLVTGSARGIGAATARWFLENGDRVIGIDRSPDAEITHGSYEHRSVDVTHRAAFEAALGEVCDTSEGVDVVVNNAGAIRFDLSDSATARHGWCEVIDVDLTAVFMCCSLTLPTLERNHGTLVNVSSLAATQGSAYLTAYSAAKAGVEQLTRSLAMEYLRRPVRINAVAPGAVDSALAVGVTLPPTVDGDLICRYAPLGDLLEPAAIAEVIGFVASPAARAIHGAVIRVDGGMSAG